MQKDIRSAVLLAVTLVGALGLGGCNEAKTTKPAAAPATAPVETVSNFQRKLCEVHEWTEAVKACKDGDIVSVLFRSWGNEHLPLVATSVVCDLRYSVVSNNSGVVCIYTSSRFNSFMEEAREAEAAKQKEQAEKQAAPPPVTAPEKVK